LTGRAVLAATALVVLSASFAGAADLRLEKSVIRLDESVVATLTLDGELAKIEEPELPLENFELEAPPAVSTHFEWIKGRTSRRRILRYRLRPLREGRAQVGPMTLRGGSEVVKLPPAVAEVLPPLRFDSSNPLGALRDLAGAGREPIVVVAEADRNAAYVGEPVIVTWWLYTADELHGVRVAKLPMLPHFWVEEIPQTADTFERVAGGPARRIAVRRAALVPLRPGSLVVDALGVDATVVGRFGERFGRSPFFDAAVRDVRRSSSPLTIEALPVPAGADAVGALSLRCGTPVSAAGLVTMDVRLEGRGHLRAARPPRLAGEVEATHDVQDRGVTVERRGGRFSMRREWRILFFPAAAGLMEVPAVEMSVFDTASESMRTLRCGGGVVEVTGASDAGIAQGEAPPEPPDEESVLPFVFGAAVAVAALLLALSVSKRGRRRYDKALFDELITLAAEPRQLRGRLYAAVADSGAHPDALFADAGAAGESFRSLVSWIDLMEKEPSSAGDGRRELEARLRQFLRDLAEKPGPQL
jgi:hypothetical protein